jgi:DNA-binding NarL/FixJ family response regulator
MTTVHELLCAADAVTLGLADPLPLVRRGLRAMIGDEAGLRIVAEAATAREAILQTATCKPDVLVVDLDMAELAMVCREARRFGTAVLAFTDLSDDRFLMSAIQAGIRGYLPKTAGPEDLIRAIRGVAGGQAIFGAHVAGKVTELLFSKQEPIFPDLTPREREILELIASGQSNGTIATRLRVAAKTVRNHTSVIFTKLGVTSRTEAMLRAREAGLGR